MRRCIALLGLLAAAWAGLEPAAAQVGTPPMLRGEVERGGAPMPGIEVILHRISMAEAGEIDTVPSAADGGFSFRLPTLPTAEADGDVYFASVRHQGIVYFGRPVARAAQLDSLYLITVHDTASAPLQGAALPVAMRYIVAEASGASADGTATGPWRVTDLFEVANEGDLTLVAAGAEGITWRHPLPAGISGVQVGGGDLSPDAARTEGGVLQLAGPIPPGQRQFILRYEVDDLDGFVVPLTPDTRQVELLVAEPAPDLSASGLQAVESVEVQPGLRFRRYVGSFAEGGDVRITLEAPARGLPLRELAVVLALLLTGAGLWAALRGTAPTSRGASAAADPIRAQGAAPTAAPTAALDTAAQRRQLMLEVVQIDERLEALHSESTRSERAELERRRETLITRIRNLG